MGSFTPIPILISPTLPWYQDKKTLIGHSPADLTARWGRILRVRCYSVSQEDTGTQSKSIWFAWSKIAFQMLKGQSGLKHGNRAKRQALKSASTDLGTADVGE